jgi:hypothetical protein
MFLFEMIFAENYRFIIFQVEGVATAHPLSSSRATASQNDELLTRRKLCYAVYCVSEVKRPLLAYLVPFTGACVLTSWRNKRSTFEEKQREIDKGALSRTNNKVAVSKVSKQ